jgi:hypothetical protein
LEGDPTRRLADRRDLGMGKEFRVCLIAALCVSVAFTCSCPFLGCVGAPEKMKKIVIDGSVEVARRDADGTITDIRIESKKGMFLVANDTKGAELFEFLSGRVNVYGRVETDREGNKVVHVIEYDVVK